MNDLELIKTGLKWLSENISLREGKEKETQRNASIYSDRQMRVIRRILDYVASQEDAVVILLRELLELPLHQNIREIAVIAITSNKPIEEFTPYEQNLIIKLTFPPNYEV